MMMESTYVQTGNFQIKQICLCLRFIFAYFFTLHFKKNKSTKHNGLCLKHWIL